jgi:hypothetical protein
MAISEQLPGLEASIWYQGSKLEEYDNNATNAMNNSRPSTTTKFVEAVSGAEYFIRLQIPTALGIIRMDPSEEIGIRISIDGKNVYSRWLFHEIVPVSCKMDILGYTKHTDQSGGHIIKKFAFKAITAGTLDKYAPENISTNRLKESHYPLIQ